MKRQSLRALIDTECPEGFLPPAYSYSIRPQCTEQLVHIHAWWCHIPAFPSILQNIPEPGGRSPHVILKAKRNFGLQLTQRLHILAIAYVEIRLSIC